MPRKQPSTTEAPASPQPAPQHLKLLGVEVADFKRVRAINYRLDPNNPALVLGGANEQGKSSFIDAIYTALCGKGAQPSMPVRAGEHKATVRLDLDTLHVHLTITEAGARTLRVTQADGANVARAQELLDSIVGKLAFDPVAFTRYEPAKQYELVRELVGLNFDDLDQQERTAYDQRTEAARKLKETEARLAMMPAPVAGLPDAPEDVAAVQAQLADAIKSKAAVTEAVNAATRAAQSLEAARFAVAQAERHYNDHVEAEKRAKANYTDPAPLEAKLRNLAERNKAIDTNTQRKQLDTIAKAHRLDVEDFSAEVEAARKARKDRLAAAHFPVAGLSFHTDPDTGKAGLTLQGVPFEQASSAEKLRCAFAIVRAMNPKLRLCFIRDGSLLDAKSLAAVTEAAREWHGQVVIETVGRRPEASLVIEDGMEAAK